MRMVPRVIRRESADKGVFVLHEDELAYGEMQLRRVWVQHPGAVVLVAVDAGKVLLVRQYRHPTGGELLELPAGTLEPGEDPADTARRELQEECGYRPRRLEPLGRLYAAPGYSSEVYHFYRAEDLEPSRLPADDDEQIEIVRMPVDEAIQRARAGDFDDAKTALGILWLERP